MAVPTVLQPVKAGLVVMFGILLIGFGVAEWTTALPVLVIAGFGGGSLTGLYVTRSQIYDSPSGTIAFSAHHGLLVGGIGGLIVYLASLSGIFRYFITGFPGSSTGAELLLFASPFAIVFFAIVGTIGGVIGSGIWTVIETR